MKLTASFLRRVNRGNLCAGCGACEAIAGRNKIKIEASKDGFYRPIQLDEICEETDTKISNVCPGLNVNFDMETENEHPIWGPYISVSEAYSTLPEVRYIGSSGGTLTALLIHLLENRDVDFVVHNGANKQNPLANETVSSQIIDTIKDGAGSRYAPSSPLADLENYLGTGKKFAFVGKPCDIAALRALQRQDERIQKQIPYMLSFFCAGVPSLNGAKKIVERLGGATEEVASFRYRGNGWPGHATANFQDGTERQMSYSDSWGGILSSHVQFRCKICPDGVGSFADIVCGDAWDCDDQGYPIFEERDGKSIVIARTAKGETLLRHVCDRKVLQLDPISISGVDAMQPGQVRRKSLVSARLLAQKFLLRPMPKYSGLCLKDAAQYASRRSRLKNFIGTIRRIILSSWRTEAL